MGAVRDVWVAVWVVARAVAWVVGLATVLGRGVAVGQTPAAYVFAGEDAPGDGEVVGVGVVLNALDAVTRPGGAFGAWQLAEFRVQVKSTGDAIPASAFGVIDDDPREAEAGFSRLAGGAFGAPVSAEPWVSGVRPAPETAGVPTLHNGNSARAGGMRFREHAYVLSERRGNRWVIQARGTANRAIGAFQWPAVAPSDNVGINPRAVLEVFRLQFRYEDRFGAVRFRFDGVPTVAYYPSLDSAAAAFVDVGRNRKAWLNREGPGPTGAIGEPIPGVAGGVVLGVGVLVGWRRRR